MTILWSNNASTTISGSITPTSTSVQLAAGTGALFPAPTGGDYYVATFYDQATKTQNEIIHVTAMAGDIATIVRAQEGTVAQNWNAGDLFANLVTAGTLRAFVQAGTGPANTSIVYVGTDTGTVNHIVATTNPVPAALATGMLFNIKIKNSNTSATDMQLNGLPALAAVRQNGGPLISGDVTASQEMTFVYNGVNFNAAIPNFSRSPPVTTFYVNTAGNDNNTGFANTPADAFATLYGAVNAIQTRYISQSQITIRVADGTYIGGCGIPGGYISSWNIIGNSSNPGNVVIDATGASPPSGSLGGICIETGTGANVSVTGFTFRSYYTNAAAGGGEITLTNCGFTAPVSGGASVIWALEGGIVVLAGNSTYTPGAANAPCLYEASSGGFLSIGFSSIYGSRIVGMNILGSPTFTLATAYAAEGGLIGIFPTCVNFPGAIPNAKKFYAATAGGIDGQGNPSILPGNQAGVVFSPGYTT
jgi:hypothetical protein